MGEHKKEGTFGKQIWMGKIGVTKGREKRQFPSVDTLDTDDDPKRS